MVDESDGSRFKPNNYPFHASFTPVFRPAAVKLNSPQPTERQDAALPLLLLNLPFESVNVNSQQNAIISKRV